MKGFMAIYNLDSYLDDMTYCILDEQRCIEILNWEDGPFPLDATLHTPELEGWRKKYVQI